MDTFFFMIMIAYVSAFVPSHTVSTALDRVGVSQSMRDGGEGLVSEGGTFQLGFFSPGGDPKRRYLGIWYNNIPIQTLVWVGNRNNPLDLNGSSASAVLTLNSTGSLILTQNGSLVWHTTSSKQADNPVAVLLDTGNLVVRNHADSNPQNYLWQSFDYPTDTSLPAMKIGWDLKNGLDWKLTSWKSPDDPSPGDLFWRLALYSYPEVYMMKGTQKFYRIGPWNGLYFSGVPYLQSDNFNSFDFVSNKDEIFYTYSLKNSSVISRAVINQTSSTYYRYVWIEDDKEWRVYRSLPTDICDTYNLCGSNGNCIITQSQVCQCLKGFSPRSPRAWNSSDWTQGCVRNKPLSCKYKHTDGFVTFAGVRVPDTSHTWVDETMGLEECRNKCLDNCSCMAYTNSDIRGAGSGCVLWFGDLIDIRQYQAGGQDLYIRMPASELERQDRRNKNMTTIVAVTIAAICGVLLLLTYFGFRVMKNVTEKSKKDGSERQVDDLDLPLFDLTTITTAADHFSLKNKIGEGGFGPVYKGTLADGQEIAIKRLSSSSRQGMTEFKNEVKLISNLQHRNLVKLLGCCIQEEEKMLVYEYMANGSLDSFIFDHIKGKLLDWPKRFHIICGIARGLVYLHQDSQLRVVHRDLKASNILLDDNLNPKISDFGIARIFGGDQTEENTKRVVGTYGYMAPEYAVDGLFSVKSDVFSFGILLLEIICGKRSRGLYHTDDTLNLVARAWTMWKEEKALELIDINIKESCVISEVLRCLHVSLLCVQQYPEDRPTMVSVILMLGSEMELPGPKDHGFILRNVSIQAYLRSRQKDTSSTNDMSITMLEGR